MAAAGLECCTPPKPNHIVRFLQATIDEINSGAERDGGCKEMTKTPEQTPAGVEGRFVLCGGRRRFGRQLGLRRRRFGPRRNQLVECRGDVEATAGDGLARESGDRRGRSLSS